MNTFLGILFVVLSMSFFLAIFAVSFEFHDAYAKYDDRFTGRHPRTDFWIKESLLVSLFLVSTSLAVYYTNLSYSTPPEKFTLSEVNKMQSRSLKNGRQ